jgi:hypothetical protein
MMKERMVVVLVVMDSVTREEIMTSKETGAELPHCESQRVDGGRKMNMQTYGTTIPAVATEGERLGSEHDHINKLALPFP